MSDDQGGVIVDDIETSDEEIQYMQQLKSNRGHQGGAGNAENHAIDNAGRHFMDNLMKEILKEML